MLAAMLAAMTAVVDPPAEPNVLWIYIEDMAVDVASEIRGEPSPIRTPNLKRLAQGGMRFTNSYAPSPVCSPSRTAAMFGQWPITTGFWQNRQPMHQNTLNGIQSLPFRYQNEGYYVSGAGKIFHREYIDPPSWDSYQVFQNDPWINDPSSPCGGGCLYFGPFENGADGSLGKMSDTKVADHVIQEMQGIQEPFFLAAGFIAPHTPFKYPESYHSRYGAYSDVVPLPDEEFSNWQQSLDLEAYDSFTEIDPGYTLNPAMFRRQATVAYWRTMTYIDTQVGRLLDALDSNGLTDRTIVVMVTDHGYSVGYHQRYGKGTLFDWSAKSWMTVAVPWLDPGHGLDCARPVDHVDLYPTLMELSNLSQPSGLDGDSLVPLLTNPTASTDMAFAMVETLNEARAFMARSDNYKFIYWGDSGLHQFYDMGNDPGEYTNLYGNPAYDSLVATHLQALINRGMVPPPAEQPSWGPRSLELPR